MTKERKLAIQMWKDIRDMLSFSCEVTRGDIRVYKYEFCKSHKLNWLNNCWLCQYIHSCSKCPLKNCDVDYSSYRTVTDPLEKTDIRMDACSVIIKALGGQR